MGNSGKPKAKSSHGGPRSGSGRKTTEFNQLRSKIVSAMDRENLEMLPKLFANLLYLANGGYERVEEKWEPIKIPGDFAERDITPEGDGLGLVERKVSIAEPDRAANIYLIDRVLGKPVQAVSLDPNSIQNPTIVYVNDWRGSSKNDPPPIPPSGTASGSDSGEAV
jgi:hypothetical protein